MYTSRKTSGTDQSLTRVRPVELHAHVELGNGRAAEHQLLSYRQPRLRGGQRELMDLISCGKGREDMGVSRRPIVLPRLQTLTLYTLSLIHSVLHRVCLHLVTVFLITDHS